MINSKVLGLLLISVLSLTCGAIRIFLYEQPTDIVTHNLQFVQTVVVTSLFLEICNVFVDKKRKAIKFSHIRRTSVSYGLLLVVTHFLVVCFGAPVISEWEQTFAFSALLVTLIVFPVLVQYHDDLSEAVDAFLNSGGETPLQYYFWVVSVSTLLGSVAGAAAIPLDWDRPWQRWSVSCVAGASVGHLIGSFLAAGLCHCLSFKQTKLL